MKNNYRKVNSCANCKHCFHDKSYEYPEIYCTLGAPPRPISVMEQKGPYDEEASDKWYDWCTGRGVGVINICDDWEKNS